MRVLFYLQSKKGDAPRTEPRPKSPIRTQLTNRIGLFTFAQLVLILVLIAFGMCGKSSGYKLTLRLRVLESPLCTDRITLLRIVETSVSSS